ncbi:PH domain-containing protein [Flavobacterium antarcticum]|uniref:PH domain-containing protein n=1 Tax=Flavobacterium antarcticum TaxID=271155 RepID=UPI00041D94FF|nr:PH domain-containing protein [Flavobacterium antarcticum]
MVSLLWLIIIFLLAIPFIPESELDVEKLPIFGIVILYLITGMLVWILLDTKYKIDRNILSYYSGPIRGKIEISKIRKVEYWNKWYSNSLLKPALGNNGLIIYYDKFADIYISPKDKEEFIVALREINPDIEVV